MDLLNNFIPDKNIFGISYKKIAKALFPISIAIIFFVIPMILRALGRLFHDERTDTKLDDLDFVRLSPKPALILSEEFSVVDMDSEQLFTKKIKNLRTQKSLKMTYGTVSNGENGKVERILAVYLIMEGKAMVLTDLLAINTTIKDLLDGPDQEDPEKLILTLIEKTKTHDGTTTYE